MAGQYKQPQRPSGGEFVSRRPPEQREFRPQRQEPASTWRQGEQPFRKPENLQVLREALKQTLEDKRKEDENSTPTQPLNNSTNFGTLKPGEKIEL